MKQVKAFPHQGGLSQIYSTGFEYSLVSENLEQCHKWVLCKDFMNDAVWGALNGKSCSIYGFSFNPDTMPHPAYKNNMLLIIRDNTRTAEELRKAIQQSIIFINKLDERMKFDKTIVEEVEYKDEKHKYNKPVFLFTLDKRWIHAPPLLSMITLFIRVGCHYDGTSGFHQAVKSFKTKITHNDASYLKQSRDMRLLILERGMGTFKTDIKDNYPADWSIGEVHNSCGIVNTKTFAEIKSIWNLEGLGTIGKSPKKPKDEVPANNKEKQSS